MSRIIAVLAAALTVCACSEEKETHGALSPQSGQTVVVSMVTNGLDIVAAARKQVGVTVKYVPDYRKIAYPNGDVPIGEGVCADVVIRALRDARKIDLQKLIHEDMRANISKYPGNWKWGFKKVDPNIDHRRVLNQQCYFKRKGWEISRSKNPDDYQPGDIVTCLVGAKRQLPHVMIVSDRKNAKGVPLIIHNIGSGAKEADVLFGYTITGHYRLPSTSVNGMP